MLGGDGTGPMGHGPRTGRGMGYCAGYPVPGFANSGFGYGRGIRRFWGRGCGRGFRRWWGFAPVTPRYPARTWVPVGTPPQPYVTKEQEIQMLEDEAKAIEQEQEALKQELEEIRKRIAELKNEKEKKE
jgi:hypothetical protein